MRLIRASADLGDIGSPSNDRRGQIDVEEHANKAAKRPEPNLVPPRISTKASTG
jgi:hypothetical protein